MHCCFSKPSLLRIFCMLALKQHPRFESRNVHSIDLSNKIEGALSNTALELYRITHQMCGTCTVRTLSLIFLFLTEL